MRGILGLLGFTQVLGYGMEDTLEIQSDRKQLVGPEEHMLGYFDRVVGTTARAHGEKRRRVLALGWRD